MKFQEKPRYIATVLVTVTKGKGEFVEIRDGFTEKGGKLEDVLLKVVRHVEAQLRREACKMWPYGLAAAEGARIFVTVDLARKEV